MRNYFLILIYSLTAYSLVAQKNKERVPSYFGFQVKPILPANFMGNSTLNYTVSGFSTSFKQQAGYSIGGVVRAGISKLIAIETGLNISQRSYRYESSIVDSNIFVDGKLRYVTYDIPVSALFYIRLADKVFMNVSVGAALSYNPTAVGVKNMPEGYHEIRHVGVGKKLVAEAIGNVGFEYRTEKSGFFYLGAAVRVPFTPLFHLRSSYKYQGYYVETDALNVGKVSGSYLAIEFKYFFHNVKSKGAPVSGPVEF